MARRSGRTPKRKQVRRYSDEQIIAALQEKKGCVHLAAASIGCNPSTIYDRIKESEAVAECATAERERVNDIAELVIYKTMVGEDPRLAFEAAKYHLNTKGRDRGYGNKLGVKAEGVSLEFIEEIVDVPPASTQQAEDSAPRPPA